MLRTGDVIALGGTTENLTAKMGLIGPDLKLVREEKLPSSVSFVIQPTADVMALNVAPSGMAGTYVVVVTGISGSISHNTAVTVNVSYSNCVGGGGGGGGSVAYGTLIT